MLKWSLLHNVIDNALHVCFREWVMLRSEKFKGREKMLQWSEYNSRTQLAVPGNGYCQKTLWTSGDNWHTCHSPHQWAWFLQHAGTSSGQILWRKHSICLFHLVKFVMFFISCLRQFFWHPGAAANSVESPHIAEQRKLSFIIIDEQITFLIINSCSWNQ